MMQFSFFLFSVQSCLFCLCEHVSTWHDNDTELHQDHHYNSCTVNTNGLLWLVVIVINTLVLLVLQMEFIR